MPGKYKRKIINFSVNRTMQIRLFIKVLGVALVGIGLMATIFYFYSNREISESYRQFHVHAKNFLEYLWPAVTLSIAAAVFFAAAITLFFPLGIAGPLYRIEKEMKEKVGEGDLSVRFELRDGDEVKNLADALNLSLEHLSGKIKLLKEKADKLEASAAGKNEEAAALAKEINEILKGFRI
ncbi:MAG: methyl-accepting chemotaxis protein [Nitrospirota bacterium]|nr:methyl-accepting chemotaxis protein [Nitrospirota bacterium]